MDFPGHGKPRARWIPAAALIIAHAEQSPIRAVMWPAKTGPTHLDFLGRKKSRNVRKVRIRFVNSMPGGSFRVAIRGSFHQAGIKDRTGVFIFRFFAPSCGWKIFA
jgi:hypothetical protein